MTKIEGTGMGAGVIPQEDVEVREQISKTCNVLQDYISNLTLSMNKKAEGAGQGKETARPTLQPPASQTGSDLAQLLLKLQEKTSDTQLKGAVEAIKANKKQMEAKHKERIKKLQEAAKKAEKAAKAGKFGKVFGWVAAGVMVALAVAACVATGGLAIGPVVGALMAVGMQVLDTTGAMGKITEGLTNLFKKMGIKEPWAQVCAMVVITAAVLAISFGGPAAANAMSSSVKAAGGVIKVARMANTASKWGEAANVISKAGNVGMAVTTLGGTAASGTAGYYQSQSLKDQAEAKDIMKLVTKIQQQLEDDEDRIKELVEKLQSGVSTVMSIMKNEYNTKKQISHSMTV